MAAAIFYLSLQILFLSAALYGLRQKSARVRSAASRPCAFPALIPVTVWGKLAENCAAHLVKGQLIEIEGRLQRRSYEKDGEHCYVTDAIAEKVHFLSKPARKEEASDDKGSKKSKAKKSA